MVSLVSPLFKENKKKNFVFQNIVQKEGKPGKPKHNGETNQYISYFWIAFTSRKYKRSSGNPFKWFLVKNNNNLLFVYEKLVS